MQQAGIPLRRVINEGNHRTWKQPVDLDGLWERALANPSQYADFVIAFEGDAVSTAVQKQRPDSARGDSCFGSAQGDDLPDSRPVPVIIWVNLPAAEAAGDASFPVIKSSHPSFHATRCNISTKSCMSEMSSAGIYLLRLVLAAVLGGAIGLEREFKHRPAGLRTNLFICLGAAMFTLLSDALAVRYLGDHTRIAAQIIPGIGFIGAGSILHNRNNLVTGITSAATLFVVASVGMAVGGGLYLTAIFGTGAYSGLPVPAGKCRAETQSQAGGAQLRSHRPQSRTISRRK